MYNQDEAQMPEQPMRDLGMGQLKRAAGSLPSGHRVTNGKITGSPLSDAMMRLQDVINANKEITQRLRMRLQPVMDMSPRPEEAEDGLKRAEHDSANLVAAIHAMADALRDEAKDKNDILDRLQV